MSGCPGHCYLRCCLNLAILTFSITFTLVQVTTPPLLDSSQWVSLLPLWSSIVCSLGAQKNKESAFNAEDVRSIPGLRRSPGEGNGYSLQYSCLGNSMDRAAWLLVKMVKNQMAKNAKNHMVKNPPAMQEIQLWFLGGNDPLEEEMATHSSILAWRIPWTEKPGGLQSMGSQRVGHDWATNTSLFRLFSRGHLNESV